MPFRLGDPISASRRPGQVTGGRTPAVSLCQMSGSAVVTAVIFPPAVCSNGLGDRHAAQGWTLTSRTGTGPPWTALLPSSGNARWRFMHAPMISPPPRAGSTSSAGLSMARVCVSRATVVSRSRSCFRCLRAPVRLQSLSMRCSTLRRMMLRTLPSAARGARTGAWGAPCCSYCSHIPEAPCALTR